MSRLRVRTPHNGGVRSRLAVGVEGRLHLAIPGPEVLQDGDGDPVPGPHVVEEEVGEGVEDLAPERGGHGERAAVQLRARRAPSPSCARGSRSQPMESKRAEPLLRVRRLGEAACPAAGPWWRE